MLKRNRRKPAVTPARKGKETEAVIGRNIDTVAEKEDCYHPLVNRTG